MEFVSGIIILVILLLVGLLIVSNYKTNKVNAERLENVEREIESSTALNLDFDLSATSMDVVKHNEILRASYNHLVNVFRGNLDESKTVGISQAVKEKLDNGLVKTDSPIYNNRDTELNLSSDINLIINNSNL
jgi:biopolymer transport protein ExbB/TolQ